MNKLVCLVGMCGAGKSEVSDYLMSKRQFGFVRFGQVTLDKIKEMGKAPSEQLEKEIRESLRRELGMDAFAKLNIPKFDVLLKKSDVIGDGLYSWEEYLTLKNRYGEKMVVVAVYAPPAVRYARIANRSSKHGNDDKLRFRNFSPKEAASRDKSEIENLHKAGPIAMADFTLLNTGNKQNLRSQVDNILKEFYGES